MTTRRLGRLPNVHDEIAAVSGHKIERAAMIIETYLPRTAPMASAAIAKLELR